MKILRFKGDGTPISNEDIEKDPVLQAILSIFGDKAKIENAINTQEEECDCVNCRAKRLVTGAKRKINFSTALEALKEGHIVTKGSWSTFLVLKLSEETDLQEQHLAQYFREDEDFSLEDLSYLQKYVPTQEDILEEDWIIF